MDTTPQTHQKRWLNPRELAQEYGISTSAQAKMRMKRTIPFSKMGNFVKYDRYEIDRWLSDHKVEMAG